MSSLQSLMGGYTSRQLTYPSDSFNAFIGIMKRFQARDISLRHAWGMPIKDDEVPAWDQNTFLWYHTMENDRLPSRRELFPSWTWVGWGNGTVEHSWYGGRLIREAITLEFAGGLRVPLTSLFAAEQQSAWESLSQPVALIWRAAFIDTSTANRVGTHQNKLMLHMRHGSVEPFLSVQYKGHE